MKFLKKLLRRKRQKQVSIPQEIERIYRENGGRGWNKHLKVEG